MSFYLHEGEVYSTVKYSGYMGEIQDSQIEKFKDTDYEFESAPQGDLFGNPQEFAIQYSPELLHITWGEGTCDHMLTRGNGSVDYAQDYETPFDQTETYDLVVEYIDKSYGNTEHRVAFDTKDKALSVFLQAPEKSRLFLLSENAEVMEQWKNLADDTQKFSKQIYDLVKVAGGVDHVYIYMVDSLTDSNEYSQNEYILLVDQDGIVYDITDDSTDEEKQSADSAKDYSSGEKVKCTVCNGTGQVKYYYGESASEAYLDGKNDYELGPCSSCDGTGYTQYNESKSSGQKVCGSCGKTVSSLITKPDASGVNRTWCSDCWSDYNSIMY